MALFQKKPVVGTHAPLYTIGLNKTLLIVGLGNPGKEYEGTRHNIGFEALDALRTKVELPDWIQKKDLKCVLTSGTVGESRVILVKPTTFMNNSGEAVQAICNFYKLQLSDLLVVHDELDIDFGQIRTRIGGSDAGNNGIKSVTQHMGEEYGRVRIGIGPKEPAQMDSADFVLAKFSADQQAQMNNLIKEVSAILTEYIYGSGNLLAETRSFIV